MKATNQIKKNLIKLSKRNFGAGLENTEAVTTWTKMLNSRVTTVQGKATMGQLNSLMHFYNKEPEVKELQSINWDSWEKELVTDGIVSKIRQNFESLMNEEYNSDEIMDQVKNSETDVYRSLNSELYYHNALWVDFYCETLSYMTQMRYIPSFNDMNEVELSDHIGFFKYEMQRRMETHNTFEGSQEDIDVLSLAESQFNWGKKIHTYWRHPSDDYRDLKATKNILGR